MFHTGTGIRLILDLINVSTTRFIERIRAMEYEESPIEVVIDLGDGVTCKQWVNSRLWLMYRGTMPGPNLIASALMALEKYLLGLAEAGHDLRDLTRNLIVQSKSASITAVVASVAMAHPDKVGDTVLALIREPLFYQLDIHRYVQDQSFFDIGEWGYDHLQKVHHRERLESSKLAHRSENLEGLTVRLQTGILRERVWKIIDDFNAELEAVQEQSEEIKLLRLKFHRMDIRNFEAKEKLPDGRVLYASSHPEADIAEVIEKSAPVIQARQEATELVVWGMAVFEGRDIEKFAPDRWREMLGKAQKLAADHKERDQLEIMSDEGGPGYVAAICMRDHWKELSPQDQTWCVDFLLSKIAEHKDARDHFFRIQRFSMSSQVAAAKVMPFLLECVDEHVRQRATEAVAIAITHAVEEVREHVSLAIGMHLWDRDSELALFCVRALLSLAELQAISYEKWASQDWQSRGTWDDFIRPEWRQARQRISDRKELVPIQHSLSGLPADIEILGLVANIIARQYHLAEAHEFYLRVAEYFVTQWEKDRRNTQNDRDFEGEAVLRRQFAIFLVRCDPLTASKLWAPIVGAIDKHPREVSDFFDAVVVSEDTAQKGAAFWRIWNDTREAIFSIPDFENRLGSDRSGLSKLASSLLFDGVMWKEDAREWKPACGHEAELQEFARRTAAAPPVFKSLIRLISGIGAFLLPQGVLWIDEALQKGSSHELVGGRNELFELARILTPLVFGRTASISGNQKLREATLRILDTMVAQGSSAAYRMRDFLISPTAQTQSVQ